MKQYMLIAALLIAVITPFSSFSQEKKGTVYIIRETGLQGAVFSFSAFVDSTLICRLNNNRFSIHEVSVGTYSFHSQSMGKKAAGYPERITIDIEEGKTYYLKMLYVDKILIDKLYMEEITVNTAKQKLKKCKEDAKCLPADNGSNK